MQKVLAPLQMWRHEPNCCVWKGEHPVARISATKFGSLVYLSTRTTGPCLSHKDQLACLPKMCLRSFQNGNAVKQVKQIQWQKPSKTKFMSSIFSKNSIHQCKACRSQVFGSEDLQLWEFKRPCMTACSAENNDDRNDKIYLSQEGLLICIFQVS